MKKILLFLLFLMVLVGNIGEAGEPFIIHSRSDSKPGIIYSRADGKPGIIHSYFPSAYSSLAGAGYVTKYASSNVDSQTAWDEARGAASGSVGGGSNSCNTNLWFAYINLNYWHYVGRGFMTFDTSSIPDDATITSAVIHINITTVNQTFSVATTQSTQVDPENLSLDDFNNITLDSPDEGATRFTPVVGAKEIILDSTGLLWINKTGWTKICFRDVRDVEDDKPTVPQAAGQGWWYAISLQSDEDISKRPRLDVTYEE